MSSMSSGLGRVIAHGEHGVGALGAGSQLDSLSSPGESDWM